MSDGGEVAGGVGMVSVGMGSWNGENSSSARWASS
jgi:hypothetical protein